MIWHEFIGEISWKRESFKEILPFFEPERKKSDKYQFWVRIVVKAIVSRVLVVFIKNSFTYQMIWKWELKTHEIGVLQNFSNITVMLHIFYKKTINSRNS